MRACCIGKSMCVCLVVSVGVSCLFDACLFSVLVFALIYFLKCIYLALTLTVLMCDGDDTDGVRVACGWTCVPSVVVTYVSCCCSRSVA